MSVFKEAGGAREIEEQEEAIESYVKKLVEQKGEHWSDPEVIAKGKVEADRFVSDLKRQNEELRSELQNQQKLDELLDLIKSQNTKPDDRGGSLDHEEKENITRSSGPSEDDLRDLVKKYVSEREVTTNREKNASVVETELRKRFGDKAPSIIAKQARDLDMTIQEVEALAADRPKAFFKLMGLDQQVNQDKQVLQGSVRRSEGTTSTGQARDWNYYQDLRRKSKNQYFSAAVQRQMAKDRAELGDRFGLPS